MTRDASPTPVTRVDGYAPLRDYAAVGDGRTVALVCRDGSVDWLTLPTIDGEPVFWSILDSEQGGRFSLTPQEPFAASRRYLPETNVLETTMETASGVVRVVDAVTLQDGGLLPWFELARKVECLSGKVGLDWLAKPRFGFDAKPLDAVRRGGVVMLSHGSARLTVLAFDAGDTLYSQGSLGGSFSLRAGEEALLALVASQGHPLPLPPREEIEVRFEGTAKSWRRWLSGHTYDGPWREAVERSALALKLLVYAPTGAIAAAPTTSLPERIGGSRNYDYRYCWVRDSTLALDALMRLGYREQAHASFSWLLDAVWRTHPRLNVAYKLDTGSPPDEKHYPLEGYRGSTPVVLGNAAAGQTQLDGYGNFLETAWLYVRAGNVLDLETSTRVGEVADQLASIWRRPDAGVWELRGQERDYTESKMMAWVCLDRALNLAEAGQLSADLDKLDKWRRQRDEIERYIETECWSSDQGSYVFYRGGESLDAAVLLGSRMSYGDPRRRRMQSTVDAVRAGLSAGGPLLYRYSGMNDEEGAFLACSFWLVEALARAGRREAAVEAMEETLKLSNDVGLFSEEIEPDSKELLGNFPQGLTHLALIMAAIVVEETEETEEVSG